MGAKIGHKVSEGTRLKISLSSKGRKHTPEAKRKIALAGLGRKFTAETKRKIALAHLGKKLSEEHKKKLSLAKIGKPAPMKGRKNLKLAGEKSHFWKGGKPKCNECEKELSYYIGKICMDCIKKNATTPTNMLIRKSKEYIFWRKAVFERDSFICIWCLKKGGWCKEEKRKINLNADHIKSFAHYPELRFAIDNGRTLCEDCHYTTDTFGSKSIIR